MIVISDTSPISNLFIIHRLYLLHDIYGKIIIPSAVYDELMALKDSSFDLSEIEQASWIEQRAVSNISLLKNMKTLLIKASLKQW
jgi:predicted nucleic acid-binding protein